MREINANDEETNEWSARYVEKRQKKRDLKKICQCSFVTANDGSRFFPLSLNIIIVVVGGVVVLIEFIGEA